MTGWSDLSAFAARLPGAVLGEAHEGSPAWYAGRHQFARLRWDDEGRELAQVWSGEMDTGAALSSRREVFPVIHTFEHRVSLWCRLDLLEPRECAELVLESYLIRGGPRRLGGLDPETILPG